MNAPIIEVDAVSKRFGGVTVLNQLSFSVTRGEKLALIGPSGSGKSTILRILMTLEPVDGGHVKIGGEHLLHMERDGRLLPADERYLRRMRSKSAWCSSSSTCSRTNRCWTTSRSHPC